MRDDDDCGLRPGTVFAGYRIVRQLGVGGMGEVYLAQHPRLPRCDALKVLPAQLSADPDFRQRFHREADLAAALSHPHIVSVHDRGEHHGQLWITMAYVEGSDAAARLYRFPTGLSRDRVIEIVTAMAGALDYAHLHKMVHRDVKPANILLTRAESAGGRILLADFGIARRTDDASGLTATNMAIGTPIYAAPEQLRGCPVDHRADQYALAATAYHLLTGVLPLPGATLTDTHPELTGLAPAVSRALSPTPADRFGSCGDFAAALLRGAAAAPQRNPAPQRDPSPQPSTKPTEPTKWSTKALFAAAAALSVLYLIGHSTPAQPATPPTAPALSAASAPSTAPAAPLKPTWVMHTLGSPCSAAMLNATMTSKAGDALRCAGRPGKYLWQLDTGVDVPAAEVVRRIGWRDCVARYPRARCETSARRLVGAVEPTGPVFPDGTYAIPDAMPYGTYVTATSRGCSYVLRGATGEILASTSPNISFAARVTISPAAAQGRFSTFGCTPWVPADPR